MRYPKALHAGDTIGVCAPSSGVPGNLYLRLDNAVKNVEALGYTVLETKSVRHTGKCVSGDAQTRADELISLYADPAVTAIIPPWGGEFLMDMLPLLDFDQLCEMPPTWICGYSDITTLTFALTLMCDIATVHGSNFMNMGCREIHASDLMAFRAMSEQSIVQRSSNRWGGFSDFTDYTKEVYVLNKNTVLLSLDGGISHRFQGRMIGGCMDVLCKLIGTQFAPVHAFLETYKQDGFIWVLESAEMHAGDIYRTLWQMRETGWFSYCNGILIGRPDGYADTQDFTLVDALEQGLGKLGIPVIYNADIGHNPPQMQVINGAYGTAEFESGVLTLQQELKE